MAQDLGGFTIARSTSVTMLLIFSVYSIIIVLVCSNRRSASVDLPWSM